MYVKTELYHHTAFSLACFVDSITVLRLHVSALKITKREIVYPHLKLNNSRFYDIHITEGSYLIDTMRRMWMEVY